MRLFSTLLERNLPLSLDEATELPRTKSTNWTDSGTISFHGMVERVARTDRLNTASGRR